MFLKQFQKFVTKQMRSIKKKGSLDSPNNDQGSPGFPSDKDSPNQNQTEMQIRQRQIDKLGKIQMILRSKSKDTMN